MYKKWQHTLIHKHVILLFIVFLGILGISFFEIIGLASISTYISILINQNANNLNFLPSFINDKIIEFDLDKRVIYGAIILFLVFLFKSIYQIFFNYLEADVRRKITFENSRKYFLSTLFSDYPFHINRNSSLLIRKIQIDISAVTAYFYNLITICKETTILLFIFTLLFVADYIVSTITFFVLGTFSIIFFLIIKKKLTRKTKETQQNKAKIIELINLTVSSFKENIILNIRKNIFSNYVSQLKNIVNFSFFSEFVLKLPRIFFELISVTGILVITYIFYLFDKPFNLIVPILTLIVTSLVRMLPSFNSLISAFSTLRVNKVIFREITNDLINQKKFLNVKHNYNENENQSKVFFKNKIMLKNVHFNYENSDKIILNDINLEIKKGESIGIIGESGSGKTTLADIILGLLQPTKGQVLIDENILDEHTLIKWHKKIGYIPQDLYLINDTIKKNIALGIQEDRINNDLIAQSIKIAKLDKFINKQIDGLNTIVGERGVKISGGEKQRISIARAFYNEPDVIIMDEATSSLDNKTEKEFMESVDNLKKQSTLIIIAHRLSTIKNCDKVVLISDAKIKDKGSYSEILNRNKNHI
jgi:ABC-type multidrug transport system fused ATPase/permease subunit